MSDQHVTEAEKSCIADAPKRKSLGQVGYESHLAWFLASSDFAGQTDLLQGPGARWENQPPMIRAQWEAIALSSLGVKL